MDDARGADEEATRLEEGRDVESASGTPRWVKVFGLVALALVLLFVVLQLTGVGGDHGPGRHGGSGGQAPPSGPTEHIPPPDVDHG